jgi:hypothetical protein
MGKATKKHRQKVAKRNNEINQKKRSFEKKINALREMIMSGKMNQDNQILDSEVEAEIETIDLTQPETVTDAAE